MTASCFWPWSHQWEKWSEDHRGVIRREGIIPGDEIIVGYYVRQSRLCTVCGKLQLREVST